MHSVDKLSEIWPATGERHAQPRSIYESDPREIAGRKGHSECRYQVFRDGTLQAYIHERRYRINNHQSLSQVFCKKIVTKGILQVMESWRTQKCWKQVYGLLAQPFIADDYQLHMIPSLRDYRSVSNTRGGDDHAIRYREVVQYEDRSRVYQDR
jgi:hypothetical protein